MSYENGGYPPQGSQPWYQPMPGYGYPGMPAIPGPGNGMEQWQQQQPQQPKPETPAEAEFKRLRNAVEVDEPYRIANPETGLYEVGVVFEAESPVSEYYDRVARNHVRGQQEVLARQREKDRRNRVRRNQPYPQPLKPRHEPVPDSEGRDLVRMFYVADWQSTAKVRTMLVEAKQQYESDTAAEADAAAKKRRNRVILSVAGSILTVAGIAGANEIAYQAKHDFKDVPILDNLFNSSSDTKSAPATTESTPVETPSNPTSATASTEAKPTNTPPPKTNVLPPSESELGEGGVFQANFFYANVLKDGSTDYKGGRWWGRLPHSPRRMQLLVNDIYKTKADIGVLVEMKPNQYKLFKKYAGKDYEIFGDPRYGQACFIRKDSYRLVERKDHYYDYNVPSVGVHGQDNFPEFIIEQITDENRDKEAGSDPDHQFSVIGAHVIADSGAHLHSEDKRIAALNWLAELSQKIAAVRPVVPLGDMNDRQQAVNIFVKKGGLKSWFVNPDGSIKRTVRIDQGAIGYKDNSTIRMGKLVMISMKDRPPANRETDHDYVFSIELGADQVEQHSIQ